MKNNNDAISFPTKDRVITLNLTFLDFYIITNCLFSISSDFEYKKSQGSNLDKDQETILSMVSGVLNLIMEQANTSSQNLDVDRVAKELDYSNKVVTPYFIQTLKKFELDKMNIFLSKIKNSAKSK